MRGLLNRVAMTQRNGSDTLECPKPSWVSRGYLLEFPAYCVRLLSIWSISSIWSVSSV